MKNYDFSYLLSRFFTTYLSGHLNVSSNTVFSYRDTFSLLLTFFKDVKGVKPEKINFGNLTRETIEDFLNWLEEVKHCSASTRNQRLAAIKSFFRYVQVELPETLYLSQNILEIRCKKHSRPAINYLTEDEVTTLLAAPDKFARDGRRDLAILSLLYDSAARVQEICDLTVRSVRLQSPATIRLIGKGRKSRFVPLSAPNAIILQKYISDRCLDSPERLEEPLFTNRQGQKLTRGGISYILAKYVSGANIKAITPHCLRHSKAMHLLEAGINLIYIRDFLGHEDVETTQVYAKANPETKRIAIQKTYSNILIEELPDWNDDKNLIMFLKGLKR